ncbi:hypothetical protein SDC9_82494 [bioreactor metagenome]|uniref:Uncharacterized protein n=1 Tax=bioreactor metagenome TaxID=1076179 RepID=A0A644Z4S7_9ZZZZ
MKSHGVYEPLDLRARVGVKKGKGPVKPRLPQAEAIVLHQIEDRRIKKEHVNAIQQPARLIGGV